MPTFAENFSARYQAKYVAAGIQHTIQFRFARGLTGAAIVTAGHAHAYNFFNSLSSLLADDFAWVSAQWCQEDTTIFIPAGSTPTAVVGTIDAATFTPYAAASCLHFPGKSDVSKAGVFAFGVFFDPYDTASPARNGIVLATESAPVLAAISSLSGGTAVTAVNGVTASWFNYTTYKVNDHVLKEVRKTAP